MSGNELLQRQIIFTTKDQLEMLLNSLEEQNIIGIFLNDLLPHRPSSAWYFCPNLNS
jgi:hypothetical protein